MRITHVDTFIANAGLRNFVFVRLRTDSGLSGVGEASLEWQECAVETILRDWAADRVIGANPCDIEDVIGRMIRDQYQGGPTVMTAISAIEMAMWDIVGKLCYQPVYKLIGGRCHKQISTYANGWYGTVRTPEDYAQRARDVVARGYEAMKFDPFGTAWKEMSREEMSRVVDTVRAVREAVGPEVRLMIEIHGRLSVESAVDVIRRLEPYNPAWCEEPVVPESLDLLAEVKRRVRVPIAAGERLYTLADFYRLLSIRAVDVVQMDIAHCGGILASKKIAAMAAVQDIRVAPHCSIGPVALAACLHFGVSTPNFMVQETFAEFDVPWRSELVGGWDPLRHGQLVLSDEPGLGVDLDEAAIARNPYKPSTLPNLWDTGWLTNFSQNTQ